MSDDAPAPVLPTDDSTLIQWRAVLIGALVGLGLLVVLSVISAVLDHYLDDFDDSGWIYPLFVGVLVGYGVAGYLAGRAVPEAGLTNGTLAGLGAFVLWIPIRILIWLVRDEDKGLFSGHAAVLRPGQLFGHVVIASALGMLGGWVGARTAARAKQSTPDGRTGGRF
jgi:hypothetical protein